MSCEPYHRSSYDNTKLWDSLDTKSGGWLQAAQLSTLSDKLTSYYQICAFKNIDGKYNVRRYQYYEPTNIVSVTIFSINSLTLNKLNKELSRKLYKIYNTYDFDEVVEPSDSELYKAQSDFI